MVLFVAPDNAERTFRRIAAALPEGAPRRFHSLLLGRPGVDLVNWRMGAEADALSALQAESGDADFVAYSGGAAMCLLYAASGASIRSLTLIEPPWIGNDEWGPEEAEFVGRFNHLVTISDRGLVEGFFDLFAPGYAPPIPDAEIAHMAAPLRAVWRGYRNTALDRADLGGLGDRVVLPVGGRSTPRMQAQVRELAKNVPGCEAVEVNEAHHFDIMIVGADRIGAAIGALLARN